MYSPTIPLGHRWGNGRDLTYHVVKCPMAKSPTIKIKSLTLATGDLIAKNFISSNAPGWGKLLRFCPHYGPMHARAGGWWGNTLIGALFCTHAC